MSTTSAPIIIAAQRRQIAVSLRTLGLGYRDIYEQMVATYGRDNLPGSYDERYVWRDVTQEMHRVKELATEGITTIRAIELDRLDKMIFALMPDAQKGNLKTIQTLLKVMDHRAKLLGLYAPSQSKVEVADWRSEVINLIKEGRITRAEAEEQLGEELTTQLLDAGSADIVEGSFTEGEGQEEK